MTEKNIPYQSSSIYYKTMGTGPAVLLLHGFGEDGTIWDSIIDALQNEYRLIIPHLPGSGGTAALTQKEVSMKDFAAVVKAILEEEKIETFHFIGHSMGGYIAMAFASLWPEYLLSLTLFHSSALADAEEKKEARRRSIDFIKNNGAYEFLKTSTPGLFSEAFKKENPGIVSQLVEEGKQFSGETLIQYYQAMINRPDTTGILASLQRPVLFIAGKQDNAVPLPYVLQQSHLPARSHFHVLRNSAHMGMLEETAQAVKILLQFLNWTT